MTLPRIILNFGTELTDFSRDFPWDESSLPGSESGLGLLLENVGFATCYTQGFLLVKEEHSSWSSHCFWILVLDLREVKFRKLIAVYSTSNGYFVFAYFPLQTIVITIACYSPCVFFFTAYQDSLIADLSIPIKGYDCRYAFASNAALGEKSMMALPVAAVQPREGPAFQVTHLGNPLIPVLLFPFRVCFLTFSLVVKSGETG